MLFVVALLATIWAMYPVVLLGRSMTSPSVGTVMLYDHPPFLPGSEDLYGWDSLGSDVGAHMWASVPYGAIESQSILDYGEIPFWNRYGGAGRPLIGQGQSFFFDPLHWVTIIGGGTALSWDIKFVLARLIFVLGVGWLTLRATRHLPASIAATFTAPFCGYFLFRYNHPAYFALCYAPWIVLCWFDATYAEAWRRRLFALAGLAVATALQIVAPAPKEGTSVMLVAELTGLLLLLSARRSVGFKLQIFLGSLCSGAIAVCLSAPHWLVFLTSWAGGATVYDAPAVAYAQLYQLSGLFFGVIQGTFDGRAGSPVICATNLMNLVFLAWAIARFRVLVSERAFLSFGLGAAASLGIVMGALPAGWLVQIPLLRNIGHVWNTFTCAAVVPLLVLGGFGFREMWRFFRDSRWMKYQFLIAIMLSLGTLIALYGDPGYKFVSNRTLVMLLALWIACCIAALLRSLAGDDKRGALVGFKQRPWTTAILVLLVVVIAIPFGLNIKFAERLHLFSPGRRPEIFASSAAVDYVKTHASEPFRVMGMGTNLMPGVQGIYQLEGIGGCDPVFSAYLDRMVSAFFGRQDWVWVNFPRPDDFPRIDPLLDMMGIRYVFTSQPDDYPLRSSDKIVLRGDLAVVERETAWPRAFFIEGVSVYDDVKDLVAMATKNAASPFAAIQRSDLATLKNVAVVHPDAHRVVVDATGYRLTPNSTRFSVNAPDPGVVVLNEAFWSAQQQVYVDGERVSPLRVNDAFIGVPVAAGQHEILVAYRPDVWSSAVGLAGVGGLALVGMLGLGLVTGAKNRATTDRKFATPS